MRSWFEAAAKPDKAADIAIYDEIGFWGITAGDFRNALAELGDIDTINLRINSPGGSVFDGLAVHNMLARHKAKKIVTVDGIAASIASLIAMAGDQIIMPENAMMMIHNPFGMAIGTSADMRDVADALDKITAGMLTTYARKSGNTPEAVAAIMDAETWLTAAEAVEQGFADKVSDPAKITAKFPLSRFRSANKVPLSVLALDEPVPEPEAEPIIEPDADRPAAEEPVTAGGDVLEAGVAAAREQMQQIAAACQLAGYADRTLAYLQSGKTLSQVQAELLTLRAARGGANAGNEISPRHNPVVDTPPPSWDSALKKINARFAS